MEDYLPQSSFDIDLIDFLQYAFDEQREDQAVVLAPVAVQQLVSSINPLARGAIDAIVK
jgi:hypothetical protein